MTSYPLFFNEDDSDCDKTTFYYWAPGYYPKHGKTDVPFLTTELRKELDGLVTQLNTVISNAIDDANTQQGRTQVHFVDVNPKFEDNHRWCEEGDFHEPNEDREDTWFFLSGWKDFDIPDVSSATQSQNEAQEQVSRMPSMLLMGEQTSAL